MERMAAKSFFLADGGAGVVHTDVELRLGGTVVNRPQIVVRVVCGGAAVHNLDDQLALFRNKKDASRPRVERFHRSKF